MIPLVFALAAPTFAEVVATIAAIAAAANASLEVVERVRNLRHDASRR